MRRSFCIALLAFAAPVSALAQEQEASPIAELVVTPSPFSAAQPLDAPTEVQTLRADDLSRTGAPSLIRALGERSGQVQLNNAQANPFQPNISYRGFEASPLVGNAQGLAVYVDGGRLNQAFGDTVNWDLIPDVAIQSVTLEGSNPVYGLNALGGSIDVRLKSGEDFTGVEGLISGGSFGRWDASAQYGRALSENISVYLALRALEEDGWRDYSPSSLRQAYADLTFSGDRHTTHLKVIGADNNLVGNATAPVELLTARRESVFTHPDITDNRYGRVSLSTDYRLTDALSLQGALYAQTLRQWTANGDAADVEACEAPFGAFVCSEDEDDEPLTDAEGAPITDFLGGEDYAFLNRGQTDTDAYGAALQLSHTGRLIERSNRFIAGLSFDGGTSTFRASSELGALSEDRGFEGPGVIVESGEIGSVGVTAHNRYYGVFFSNLLELSPTLSATISGRYNHADVTLRDLIGTALNGDHKFDRFNPAVGLTWKPVDGLSVYAGYSEANRAPTPAELSCADPAAPCSLTNFFIGDPPLEQVVAKTFEAGLRKRGDSWRWSLSAFSTRTEDDIMFIASPILGRAYFQNVGETERRGATVEGGVQLGRAFVFGAVSLIDATFQSPLVLNSPENPFADANGLIQVQAGDDLPGVATTKAKIAVDYDITDRWSLGATATYQTGSHLFGDEANLDTRTDGFTVVNLATTFDVNDTVELFASVENLLDQEYETFGTYSPVDEVPLDEVPNASNTRSLSPGAPRAVYVGLKFRF